MLKIAICDDQPDDLSVLRAYVGEFLSQRDTGMELRAFTHPDTLLTAMAQERFPLYILDIVLPMMSGLELGREIRRLDREAQIIYATTEPQFALQAYAASPINYLVKPLDKEQLFDTLDLAVSKIDLAGQRSFPVKTAESLRVLKLEEIVCCEYRNHTAAFTLTTGEELVSRSFRESFAEYATPLLRDRHFLQCHTAFAVNMRWVECFAKDSFTLCGGKAVPIAARQYPAVRDAYMDYLMGKGADK